MTVVVNSHRNHFLARPRFSADENRAIRIDDPLKNLKDGLHCRAVTDNVAETYALIQTALEFVDLLTGSGADVLACPTIEIGPPASWAPLDAAIGRVDRFSWIVFTSVNGVRVFFERLRTLGRDVRSLHRARIAAVGSRTAAALADRGVLVDVVPREFRGEAVAQAMREVGVAGSRVLLPRAAEAREVLPRMLVEAGAEVEEVASYRTIPLQVDADVVRRALVEKRVDLVTFTSSSTVRSFLALLGEEVTALLQDVPIGCIGPITADTARAAGLDVKLQPEVYTIPSFADAILAHFAALPKVRLGG